MTSNSTESSIEEETTHQNPFSSDRDSEKGTDSFSLFRFVKDKVSNISSSSSSIQNQRKRRSEDVITLSPGLTRNRTYERPRSLSDVVGAEKFVFRTLRQTRKTSVQLDVLLCEKMTPDEFDRWLDEQYLSRLRCCFSAQSGLLVKGERRNSLEVSIASLEELFEILVLPLSASLFKCFDRMEFEMVFLCTYEMFVSPEILFSNLYDAYVKLPSSFTCLDTDVKKSVLSFLEKLTKMDYHRFDSDLKLAISDLLCAAKEEFPIFSEKRLFGTGNQRNRKKNSKIPRSIIPNDTADILKITDIHLKEMARQLTLKEESLFKNVRRIELLNGEYSDKTKAPNLTLLMEHQQKIVSWVRTEILRRGNASSRTQIISYFLRVANELYLMKNYSTFSQVILALNSTEIQKLKRSWSKEQRESLNNFLTFLYEDRYKDYLSEVESMNEETSFIPMLSYICDMTTKLNEVLHTKVGEKINWNKMKSHFTIMKKGGMMKNSSAYSFAEVEVIQEFLERAEVWEDEDLRWRVACSLEESDKNYEVLNVSDLWENIEFNEAEWEFLYRNAVKEKYKKGEIIIHENSEMRKLYQIKTGQVRELEGNQEIRILGEFTVMGFNAYLNPFSGYTSKHTFIAATDVCLFSFKSSEILSLCEVNTHFSGSFNRWVALQLMSDSIRFPPPDFWKDVPTTQFERVFGVEDEIIEFEVPCHAQYKNNEGTGNLICTQNYLSFIADDETFSFLREFEDAITIKQQSTEITVIALSDTQVK
eukprot:TRINITY_DN2530_c0_g1_i1.p1 TRINITY_DN2530_c0_g1~~TRINITY_DN2530_c0_g1_i1.p1  ORF type:complete len:760 (-),score=158.34 TRINITY_DN2530_c0_g1_i1:616-2895(-)